MEGGVITLEYYVPEQILTNDELCDGNENWTAAEVLKKTGIVKRYITDKDECASDLAVHAAKKCCH